MSLKGTEGESESARCRVRRRSSGVCAACGGRLPHKDRIYCDICLPAVKRERQTKFTAAGQAALARLRAEGHDPMCTKVCQSKLRTANLRRLHEERAWNALHEKPDARDFVECVLPALQTASLTQMRRVTGLSISYCATIRRGTVPHPRHWDSLRRLVHDDEAPKA